MGGPGRVQPDNIFLFGTPPTFLSFVEIQPKIREMMNIPTIFWVVPAASVVALAFCVGLLPADEARGRRYGNVAREIAAHVRKGAMAYLRQQYKVVGIVFCGAVVLRPPTYGAGVQNE